MKLLIVLIVMAVLVGCVGPHGALQPLPEISSIENSAEIYIVRNKNFAGGAVNYKVTLNSREILGIGIGEYTKFNVDPGEYAVGVICNGGWTPGDHFNEKKALVKANTAHYFMARAGGVCAVIEVLGKADAEKAIENAKFVRIQ